jgi:DNA-binding NtrC family response regulator
LPRREPRNDPDGCERGLAAAGMLLALGQVAMQIDTAPERGSDTVLVIDDSRAVSLALASYFGRQGYAVDCAHELEEALALIAHRHYRVVIVDLRLTESETTNGLEVLDFVRQRSPATRTVVLTAFGSPLLAMEAQQRGASAFVYKSDGIEGLGLLVASLLGKERTDAAS